ncbi:hypothetical protein DWX58_10685 [Pseudoflavonifractor sp. AF19-9AC]|uniref:hypothetical protein n=1 Tax=Pseudoflavonifractor sp. AF19-9AC TaxID=2292244 RepID=UPI000E490BAB|nr:hypothetical protein [Pseudoflavonifractor sp. AF19-9AC]RHR07322.1 hypothetical protein DWX58_10685 [Pseudoflavonifractor sp. AF19-9AC]
MNRTSPTPPRSPFATHLSGSARETELRIRNIFQWKKKRPPLWLMALVGAVILLCGSLVSCQSQAKQASPVELQLQYYDQLGNYVEVPALAVPETEDARALNEELSALATEYRTAIDQISYGQQGDWFRCLCYPTQTDRYLSLVLYRYDQGTAAGLAGFSPTLSTWVYDRKEGRLVTEDEAWSLAGTSLEALRAQLAEETTAAPTDNQVLEEVSLAGFRIGEENQVTVYLSSVHTSGEDVEFDRLYQWQGGTLERCPSPSITPQVEEYLVPAEETMELSPALWCRWNADGGEPEGGWDPVPMSESVQNHQLARRTIESYEYLYGTSEYRLFSHAQGSRTLMLVESTGAPHAAGLDNLVLGVWDEDAQDFTGESYLIGGDNGLWSTWEEGEVLWLLCSNSTTYQGDETCSGLGLFRFADSTLERVLELPQAALDSSILPDTEEARYLLHPQGDSETGSLSYTFWSGRLAIPGEGGFDLYEKNPSYNPYHPTSTPTSQWLYRGFVPLSDQKAAVLSGGDPQARSYYASLLENVLIGQPLPDALYDFSADRPVSPSRYIENRFGVYDVDGDGREELLLSLYTTIVAGQGTYVLDYQADTDTLLLQSPDRFGLEPIFYENGTVLSPWSHNQGWGGRFWPYTVYQYEPGSDSYSYAGSADAWDRKISDQNPDFPAFPEELDVSNSGFLYYLDGDDTPVDESVYLQWLEGHTGGTSPLPVQWFALTEQNIARLSGR